jgi:AcrR family transcriptional regulator
LSTTNFESRSLLNKPPNLSDSQPAARKLDRRVSRTRRQLREALFNLILEKGYDAATVEEITARADVGRTTFYLHYHDKEDLLMESIGELVDDLIEHMARIPLGEWKLESGNPDSAPSPAIALPFQHVASNARLYRIVLRGEGTYSVSRRLREIIAQASAEMIRVLLGIDKLGEINSQVPMDVFINYLAGAWLGLITWWLENEMPYPAEHIAGMFQRMVVQGAPEALGFPSSST